VQPAVFADGTDRRFRAERRAQLAHQHHIPVGIEPLGDQARHRHRAARNAQHQRAGALQVREHRR